MAAAQQVDDLVVGAALVDRGAVGYEREGAEVLDALGAEVLDGGADVLRETPVSNKRLTTFKTSTSAKLYRRSDPLPAAGRRLGTTRPVRAQ